MTDCFVLCPAKDPAAVAALRAYAATTDNAELAADIINWVGAEPNEWVSVEERLPEESDGMVLLTNGKIVISGYRNQLFGLDGKQGVFAPSIKRGGGGYMQVTYWMHLPEPPGKEKNR